MKLSHCKLNISLQTCLPYEQQKYPCNRFFFASTILLIVQFLSPVSTSVSLMASFTASVTIYVTNFVTSQGVLVVVSEVYLLIRYQLIATDISISIGASLPYVYTQIFKILVSISLLNNHSNVTLSLTYVHEYQYYTYSKTYNMMHANIIYNACQLCIIICHCILIYIFDFIQNFHGCISMNVSLQLLKDHVSATLSLMCTSYSNYYTYVHT